MGGNGINTLTKDAIGGLEPPYLPLIDSPESVPHHFKYKTPLWRQSEMPAGLQLAAVLYGAGGEAMGSRGQMSQLGLGWGWLELQLQAGCDAGGGRDGGIGGGRGVLVMTIA